MSPRSTMLRIGCGAGYSGDRIDPAVELAEQGALDYLIFECLGERTVGLAQQARVKNPDAGYDPLLADRMDAVLPACRRNGTRIITNMGAAHPAAAARVIRDRARQLGLTGLRIAAVTGDDVIDRVRGAGLAILETGGRVDDLGGALISANAYIGAEPIVAALAEGADVVVTGRAADPSLFVAPQVHAFGWGLDDWARLGRATLVGHLLECAGQVTGGYFADPGVKDVAGLARLGFPLAEIEAGGAVTITKVSGSGGLVTTRTCKEQLLYEVHDPSRYLTPDVTADFSQVRFVDAGADRVRVDGGTGRERPATLKVSLGYLDGYIGEGQISYGGPGAVARGRLAQRIVAERLAPLRLSHDDLRIDLIGVDALFAGARDRKTDPAEVRLRVAARTQTMADAVRIGNEVETLYTNGPAGGGGATRSAREVLAIGSTFVPRTWVTCRVSIEVS